MPKVRVAEVITILKNAAHMKRIVETELACGMVLVAESIPNVSSLAIDWCLPVGSASDPPNADGLATLLSELIFRGAGGLSSREHSDALDRLGVQRTTSLSAQHLHVEATLLGGQFDAAAPLLTAMAAAPALPEDAIEPVRQLCLQSLDGLDDDPQHLVMLRLRERHLPPPMNRHGYGERHVLETARAETLRSAWADRARPRGAIFAAAGEVDPASLARRLDELLPKWRGEALEPAPTAAPARGYLPIIQESAQLHLGVAWDAPFASHPASTLERVAVAALSGSTSGRLFSEVRQKRALCYSVGARYRAGRDRGFIALYAGTTPERAQETLEVCLAEINRFREGVTREEFARAITGLKSHLVMQGESTPSRAGALANDRYCLARCRSLDEIAAEVDAITFEALNAYLARREFGSFTIVTLGPSPLAVPAGAAAAV